MKHITKISLLFLIILFTGCSQKITLKTLIPASIDDKDIKNVSIENFKNDTVSLKDNISSQMNNITFNNNKYFNIVNRKDTDKILNEQKLQDSGLVNNTDDKYYGLSDINSIISGSINSKKYEKNQYYETRTDYDKCLRHSKDKKVCEKYYEYKVSCQSHIYSLNSNINITRVSNADIIFSKTFNVSTIQDKCNDENIRLISNSSVFNMLSKDISKQFVVLIAPSYKNITLELIDDEDIDYTDKQSKLLENALKLIELNDIQSANKILQQLVNLTKYQSSTALYNLAITYEYLNQYENANNTYQKAKNITIQNDMNELIIYSANRIKKVIENRDKAIKQIID